MRMLVELEAEWQVDTHNDHTEHLLTIGDYIGTITHFTDGREQPITWDVHLDADRRADYLTPLYGHGTSRGNDTAAARATVESIIRTHARQEDITRRMRRNGQDPT